MVLLSGVKCCSNLYYVMISMYKDHMVFLFFSACISKYSGGCVHHYPMFHAVKNPSLTEKYEADLRRYLTRKIGFEAVMRIRCTKGKSTSAFS